jgi:hypothetical protein
MPIQDPIPLSDDVVDYVRSVFAEADDAVTARLERQPNVHEESLDMAFIDAVAASAGPHRTQSQAVVDIDIHFVGGGWHYERWEVADIGILVTFRRLNEVLRRKVVLLQSKRLYPREAEFQEAIGLARPGGFGYFVRRKEMWGEQTRLFRFDPACRYRALQIGDSQWAAIQEYESRHGIPVHYCFYQPGSIPFQVTVPIQWPLTAAEPATVATRVMSATIVRANSTEFARNYAPSFADLAAGAGAPGVRLPGFIADEVLACNEGYVPAGDFFTDAGVNRIFNERAGPISSAIAIDIELPE